MLSHHLLCVLGGFLIIVITGLYTAAFVLGMDSFDLHEELFNTRAKKIFFTYGLGHRVAQWLFSETDGGGPNS